MTFSYISLRKLLYAGGIISFLVFCAGYFSSEPKNTNFTEGNAYISIVLDVSKSMNVEDVENNRLIFSKNLLWELLENTSGYNYGLTIFAWDAQRVLPFTADKELFLTFLQGISYKNITKQGSDINQALAHGIAQFWKEKTGYLLLYTDGWDDPIKISSEIFASAKEKNLHIFVIWIGTKSWGNITTGDFFTPYEIYNGEYVVSKISRDQLQNLAQEFQGEYGENKNPKIPKMQSSENSQTNIVLPHFLFLILTAVFWIFFLASFIWEYYFPFIFLWKK